MLFYSLMHSLKQATLIKIAISLWDRDDRTRYRILTSYSSQDAELEVENTVIQKVPELPLPDSLKEKVSNLIKPIGLEILKWRKYHENVLSERIEGEHLMKLCWTCRGTVDTKKTAEALVKDESLDITKCYKIACLYCLEADVVKIWSLLPQSEKAAFCNKRDPNRKEHTLVLLWSSYMQEDIPQFNDFFTKLKGNELVPNESLLNWAADQGNKVAFEYFFLKLTPQERGTFLKHYALEIFEEMYEYSCLISSVDHVDVVIFLLSQMNEEQQVEILKHYSFEVLDCLLNWPWQSFFMETANFVWPFLDGGDICRLMIGIVEKVIDGYKDWNYQKLFKEFFQQIPVDKKKYLSREKHYYAPLIQKLVEAGDHENLKLMQNFWD